jgi:hypothetical protein
MLNFRWNLCILTLCSFLGMASAEPWEVGERPPGTRQRLMLEDPNSPDIFPKGMKAFATKLTDATGEQRFEIVFAQEVQTPVLYTLF